MLFYYVLTFVLYFMLVIMGSVMALCAYISAQTETDCCHAYVIHSAVLLFLL
jgi:hypothetical protein